jgi:hypothetical protein
MDGSGADAGGLIRTGIDAVLAARSVQNIMRRELAELVAQVRPVRPSSSFARFLSAFVATRAGSPRTSTFPWSR